MLSWPNSSSLGKLPPIDAVMPLLLITALLQGIVAPSSSSPSSLSDKDEDSVSVLTTAELDNTSVMVLTVAIGAIFARFAASTSTYWYYGFLPCCAWATANAVSRGIIPRSVIATALSCCWITFEIFFRLMQNSMLAKSLQSEGQVRCICIMMTLAVMFFIVGDISFQPKPDGILEQNAIPPLTTAFYAKVALAGFLGCCATCVVMSNITNQWLIRLIGNIMGPLIFVEFSLSRSSDASRFSLFGSIQFSNGIRMPLSIQWLLQFLSESESGYPRYYGLLYWGAMLLISSVPTYFLLTLPPERGVPVVITRKWFHLVAVTLFSPIIYLMPELMSLSFAIAMCVLMVLETLRRDLPFLQTFYKKFVDATKDHDDQIIVSHFFLIFGCAVPLWLSQIISTETPPSSSTLKLAQFGVACIGIGDAMGAVVGKMMGRRRWGRNNRTLEGSLAMWASMMTVGFFCCHTLRDWLAWTYATTFTTVMEAFTMHLDNFVLPLAGSIILLLS